MSPKVRSAEKHNLSFIISAPFANFAFYTDFSVKKAFFEKFWAGAEIINDFIISLPFAKICILHRFSVKKRFFSEIFAGPNNYLFYIISHGFIISLGGLMWKIQSVSVLWPSLT